MNADPVKARQAKKARRRGKPGSVEDAQCLVWRALERAAEMLEAQTVDPETGLPRPDNALALKAVHAVSQCAASYARIVDVGELAARVAALEARSAEAVDPLMPGPRLAGGAG